jgi:hypothetical protein
MVFQTYLNKAAAKRAAMGFSKFQSASSGLVRGIQSILVLFSTLTAVSIIGSAAHVYHTYKSQQANYNPWWLPIWAAHFDTSGLKTTIGTASGIALLDIIYLAMLFIPKVR